MFVIQHELFQTFVMIVYVSQSPFQQNNDIDYKRVWQTYVHANTVEVVKSKLAEVPFIQHKSKFKMNAIVIASLSLVVLAQSVNAVDFTKKCKANTEPCLKIRCTATQTPTLVPFHLHYSCCNGKLFDQKKYVCVRYRYGFTTKIALVRCDNCTQFTCGDGQCTMKEWKCNNVKDCLDGSDEIGCGPCASNQFYCRRARQCIHADKVCDKYNDCKDGSDEVYCPNKNTTLCGINYYRCSNGKECIPWNKACDTSPDCDDGSDEAGNCSRDYTKKYGRKRDEMSNFFDDDGLGGNGVDAAKRPIVS